LKVSIKRKAKSTWHKDWVSTIRNACDWASKELNLDSKQFTLDIRLKHDYNVDYYGVQLSVDPLRRSVIILNSALLDRKQVVEILFHEMVHVAQEFHQGLHITECMTEAHFEGMVYNFEGEDQFFGTHSEHPWEIDAYKRQDQLKEKYRKFLTKTA
jgi:hypothetical protein